MDIIPFITSGQDDLSLLAGCLVGACVGFLWFNAFPATIFMGDTGSLGLGGAIAGMAVMLLFGFSLTWIFAIIGLSTSNAETAISTQAMPDETVGAAHETAEATAAAAWKRRSRPSRRSGTRRGPRPIWPEFAPWRIFSRK